MTKRRLSPIEMMIDRATGYDPNAPRPSPKLKVMLRCPKCGRKQRTSPEADDPPRTATVIIQCPKCNGGDFDSPRYEDADGNDLPWHESGTDGELPTSGEG